jgi:3,4-dihydroxy 2-butanone 4-phosphate synthase/GTP cyclohydrolase II
MSRSGLARAAGLTPIRCASSASPTGTRPPTRWPAEKLLSSAATRRAGRPEQIIDEARNGRMFILVDDEDRENEGDLVIPAQMATPDAINFMAGTAAA